MKNGPNRSDIWATLCFSLQLSAVFCVGNHFLLSKFSQPTSQTAGVSCWFNSIFQLANNKHIWHQIPCHYFFSLYTLPSGLSFPLGFKNIYNLQTVTSLVLLPNSKCYVQLSEYIQHQCFIDRSNYIQALHFPSKICSFQVSQSQSY